MNRHKNARTTPYGRALMVRRVRELGWSAARECILGRFLCLGPLSLTQPNHAFSVRV